MSGYLLIGTEHSHTAAGTLARARRSAGHSAHPGCHHAAALCARGGHPAGGCAPAQRSRGDPVSLAPAAGHAEICPRCAGHHLCTGELEYMASSKNAACHTSLLCARQHGLLCKPGCIKWAGARLMHDSTRGYVHPYSHIYRFSQERAVKGDYAVQAIVRGWLARRSLVRCKGACITLQAHWRGHVARRRFARIRAAVVIQKHVRGRQCRSALAALHRAATQIQVMPLCCLCFSCFL